MAFKKMRRQPLPLLLAAVILSAGYLQAQAPPQPVRPAQAPPQPVKIGPVTFSGNLRTRIEAHDFFRDGAAENTYTFSGSLLRLSFSQQTKHFDWQAELAAPILLGVPDNAVAPGVQGQLGQGGSYLVANDLSRNSGMVFLKQGFLRFKGLGGSEAQSLRLGRYEFLDGAETTPKDPTLAYVKRERIAQRLVGNFGWVHVGRVVEGVQYVYNKPNTNLTVLAARPIRGVFQVDAWGGLDIGVFSVALTRAIPLKNSAGEWRAFAIQYDDWRRVLKTDNRALAARRGDTDHIRITTVGGNYLHAFNSDAGKFDLLFWGVLQTGMWGVLDHRAGAGAVEAGYQPPIALKPWIRAGFFHGTGDGNPNDREHNTFFQILPTARVYARYPFYNLMNSQDLSTELLLRPHPRLTLRSAMHWLRLSSRNDLWYLGPGAFQPWTFGYAGRPSNGNRGFANVFDINADFQVNPHSTIGMYFANVQGKTVISSIYPNGPSSRFGYVEFTYRF